MYLKRPTRLKGFDFQVNVEGLIKTVKPGRGPTREMPSHADVLHDLPVKLAERPGDRGVLFDAVAAVYDCGDPVQFMKRSPRLAAFWSGWPVDPLLLTVKWLMIEQDVTYWLETGRDMLMSAIGADVFSLPDSSIVV